MLFIDDLLVDSTLAARLQPRSFTSKHDLHGHTVYAYLREEDDEYGPAGSVRYVGEGVVGRAISKDHGVRVPTDKKFIVILTDRIVKVEGLELENKLVKLFGKICDGTGILENIKDGGGGFGRTGLVSVLDKNGDTITVSVNDERYVSGELVGVTTGMRTVRDKFGKTHYVKANDHRIVTGELVGLTKGRKAAKDKDGHAMMVDVNDIRLITGELVGIKSGKSYFKTKDGDIVFLDSNDERVKSGEVIGINAGKTACRDRLGNIIQVSVDDPRISTGELSHVNTGKNHGLSTCEYCGLTGATHKMKTYHHENCKMNPNRPDDADTPYTKRPTSTCEYCGKTGDVSLMKRWHHENCKHKE